MATENYLVFVALDDVDATLEGGSAADLTRESTYGNIKTITFNNEQTLIVEDDDAVFDDDDGFNYNRHDNEESGRQTVVDDGDGPIADGTQVDPEWAFGFSTSTGESYRAYAVSETDPDNGDILGIHGFAFEDPPPPIGTKLTLTSSTYTDRVAFAYEDAAPVCFTPGTLIETACGPVPAEQLGEGDLLMTLDHGLQPLKLVFQTAHPFGIQRREHNPILFEAGSLGNSLPRQDLGVSPQHRILMDDPSECLEVLVPAKAFLGKSGVRQMPQGRSVTYIHLVMERHEVLMSNGMPSESFFPGPQALKSLSGSQYRDLVALFPGLAEGAADADMALARTTLTVRRARQKLDVLALPDLSFPPLIAADDPVFSSPRTFGRHPSAGLVAV